MNSFYVVLMVVVSGGCERQCESKATTPITGLVEREEWSRMHQRFDAANRIVAELTRGDLVGAQSEAHVVDELDEPKAAPRWRPYFSNVSASALAIERADSLAAAARSTATMARQCAACHEQVGATIKLRPEPKPPEGLHVAGQMRTHQWAAQHMWEGLIASSNERWLTGATELSTIALTLVAGESTAPRSNISGDVEQVRIFANRALASTDQDARALIFGEILGTCSHCHAAIRDY